MASLRALKAEELIPLTMLPSIPRLLSLGFTEAVLDPGAPPGALPSTQLSPQGSDSPGQFSLQSERWCDFGPHDPLPGQKHPLVLLESIKRKQHAVVGNAKWYSGSTSVSTELPI